MNDQATAVGSPLLIVSLVLIAVIFYVAYRFVTRAKKVNKQVREHEKDIVHDDTA